MLVFQHETSSRYDGKTGYFFAAQGNYKNYRVWDVDDGIGIRPAVTATLSADHRATDGHIGARFLADVARRLGQPEELR